MTANQRLKRRWSSWRSGSVVAAVAAHAAILILWPSWHVPLPEPKKHAIELIQLRPILALSEYLDLEAGIVTMQLRPPEVEPLSEDVEEIEIDPETPAEIFNEPAPVIRVPVMSAKAPSDPSERVDPSRVRRDRLPGFRAEVSSMVAPIAWPEIRNPRTMQEFLRSRFNSLLEEVGATGAVVVALWVDEHGTVEQARVSETSGDRVLDEIALALFVDVATFRPARDGLRPIPVQFTVTVPFMNAW